VQSTVSQRGLIAYIAVMKAYFFDLDGTLTDSRAGLYPAFRKGLEAIDVPPVGDDQLRLFLGTPLPQMFRAMRSDVEQRDIDAGMAAFRAIYEKTGIEANELYPGIIPLLAGIRQRKAKIWVVTSKPEAQAKEVVKTSIWIRMLKASLERVWLKPIPKWASLPARYLRHGCDRIRPLWWVIDPTTWSERSRPASCRLGRYGDTAPRKS
jgi:phosphoglycolate phosphatase-like HAD superfamily hydrolase